MRTESAFGVAVLAACAGGFALAVGGVASAAYLEFHTWWAAAAVLAFAAAVTVGAYW